jgi:hypothetical protein
VFIFKNISSLILAGFLVLLCSLSLANAATLNWVCRDYAGNKFSTSQACISYADTIFQQYSCSVSGVSCSEIPASSPYASAASIACSGQSSNCTLNQSLKDSLTVKDTLKTMLLWNVVTTSNVVSGSKTGSGPKVH